MNQRLLSCLTLLLAALTPARLASAKEQLDPLGVAWLGDWSAARELAVESGRPLLVVFRCET